MVSQVCSLSEELRSVREERDALISARSEAHQRLKEAQDQLLKMESDLVDAQLKEAELTQQLTETSERLQNLQTDLQHVSQENRTRLASLEEATQKVRSHVTLHTIPAASSDSTPFLLSVGAVERRAGVCPRRERCASV